MGLWQRDSEQAGRDWSSGQGKLRAKTKTQSHRFTLPDHHRHSSNPPFKLPEMGFVTKKMFPSPLFKSSNELPIDQKPPFRGPKGRHCRSQVTTLAKNARPPNWVKRTASFCRTEIDRTTLRKILSRHVG